MSYLRSASGVNLASLKTYVVICMLLITTPYIVTSTLLGNEVFKHVVSITFHLVASSIICTAMWIGYKIGRGRLNWSEYNRRAGEYIVPGWILYLPIIVSIMFNLVPILVFLQNPGAPFYEIREMVTGIPGTGVGYYAYAVTIIPFINRRGGRNIDIYIIILLIASIVGAGILLSARMAIFFVTMAVAISYSIKGGVRLKFRHIALIAICLPLIVVVPVYYRLLAQGHNMGGVIDEFYRLLMNNILYYTDTMNKFYIYAFGNANLDTKWYLLFLDKLENRIDNGQRLEDPLVWEQFLLQNQNNNLGLFWLNNPGGLTQDASDFGALFGIVLFLKFMFAGFVERMVFRGRMMYLCLYPTIAYSIFEYPRFNLIYMPTGISLIILAFIYSIVIYLFRIRDKVTLVR